LKGIHEKTGNHVRRPAGVMCSAWIALFRDRNEYINTEYEIKKIEKFIHDKVAMKPGC
jgi:hypothetical protein